jgi:starch phosphorylase
MRPLHTFCVEASLPAPLVRLRDLAFNLRWTWDGECIDLFRRIDRDAWERTYHNPLKLLGEVTQERLHRLAEDAGFLAHLERALSRLDEYLGAELWYQRQYPAAPANTTAYFSAEFGITESLPIYSGGLGILAGDHLKSASDLGIPLVAVGLLYQRGYFRQYLNADGWQQELYVPNDFHNMAIQPVAGKGGAPLTIEVEYPGRIVRAQIWCAQVGRVPLYLLDTNLPANSAADRNITGELYGGDMEHRIQQEILLGIGGIRALSALSIEPIVCHMNEGHSAFLALERARLLMKAQRLAFHEAWEAVAAGTVFTTHTPVPAGIDVFPAELIDRYLSSYYRDLGLSREAFLALGEERPGSGFSMAVLGLRLATQANGVSKLHSQVSRKMWRGLWPQLPFSEIPVKAVTNGIHYRSWISREMAELYDRYLGTDWQDDPASEQIWKRVEEIPDEELWRTHERRRAKLIAQVRSRLRQQLERRGASDTEIRQSTEIFDSRALTIGFARRFATYKRATLLWRDVDRLARILANAEQPVQIIYAGKAHPRDHAGKEFIRQIVHLSRLEGLRHRVAFIEEYDICLARYLVQGVDVWLNTPRRPLEASGTSGMKAAANAVLNLSVLDGWWDEAYASDCGWAIGQGEEYEDSNYQDEVESQALYHLLEKEVVPAFYRRGAGGLPRDWIKLMKSSLRRIAPFFNTSRMVRQYTEECYKPAAALYRHLADGEMMRARVLARDKAQIRERWPLVKLRRVDRVDARRLVVGSQIKIRAEVDLAGLNPENILAEVFHGTISSEGDFIDGRATAMSLLHAIPGDGVCVFEAAVCCERTGLYGYSVRLMPQHPDLAEPRATGLIHWANA